MDKICVWEIRKNEIKKVYSTEAPPVQRLIHAMLDGKHVCTGSYEGDLLLWNTEVKAHIRFFLFRTDSYKTYKYRPLDLPFSSPQLGSVVYILDHREHGLWLAFEKIVPVVRYKRCLRLPVH